jgi:GTPase SAR1 family protein
VYSITDRASFEEIDQWIALFQEHTNCGAIFIVANKIDLEDERTVSEDEGRSKAVEKKAFFAEVSAKTGEGIVELFDKIPERVDTLHAENMKERVTYHALGTRAMGMDCKC